MFDPISLKNIYFGMRHGFSEGNAAGIIASSPERALNAIGLTELGRKQVLESLHTFRPSQVPIVYSSDYLRTKQTAELAAQTLQTAPVIYTAALRERDFGALDGRPVSEYPRVWNLESDTADLTKLGVESAVSVLNRVSSVILEIEQIHTGQIVLLISHGDPLQILLTRFQQKQPWEHRRLKSFQTGEIRKLN